MDYLITHIRLGLISCLLILSASRSMCQDGFSDQTRALYILDISKYVDFGTSFLQDEEFVISILTRELNLYWELERFSKTRKTVQDKPIRILVSTGVAELQPSHVVFVDSREHYRINDVLKKIADTHTLLISEGYPFRSSMINFVVVEGQPRFEANEELMKQKGLFVNELFLAQAVKTREDWEALYQFTEEALEQEKNITEQQQLVIEQQEAQITGQQHIIDQQGEEIRRNNELLVQLRNEVMAREAEIERQSRILQRQQSRIEVQNETIRQQAAEVTEQNGILAAQVEQIIAKEQTISDKEQKIVEQDRTLVLQAEAIQKQRIIIYGAVIAVLLLFGLVYFIWRNYRNKKRANVLLKAQRDQIAYQKKHITDSINYAKKIQTAILPSMELFSDKLDHFVLFKPRDIVSGDFYWVEEADRNLIIIAADCTGHGVPGAFMSMLGISLLNEIVKENGIHRPDQILNLLRQKIIEALKQEKESRIMDGMDMAVCLYDPESGKLLYSGAVNPLYHISGSTLDSIRADNMPVAIHEVMEPFTLHEVDLKKGDTFYIFSDGFVDQFGGPLKKKYMAKHFREFLLSIQGHPMIDQGKLMNAEFEGYRREVEQVDDVVVIGVRYT